MSPSKVATRSPLRGHRILFAWMLAASACTFNLVPSEPDVPVPSDLSGDPGTAPDGASDDAPDTVLDVAADACTPACDGRSCGPDGCGGTCGTCPGLCGGAEPAPCSEGVCAQACCPYCGDRECGPDGCAGLCGTCDGGRICAPLSGTCVDATCDWATEKPAAWGPAGQLWELACPSDKAVYEATCFDFTGDGLGDNGMKSVCNQLVAALVPVEPAPMPLVAVLDGATDLLAAPSFTLTVQPVRDKADPPLPAGEVQVAEAGYDTDTCRPLYAFPGASIVAGRLSAGPTTLELHIALDNQAFTLPIQLARIDGQVQPGGGASGFDLRDGRVTGVVLKQSVVNLTNQMNLACDAAPVDAKPSYCSNMKTAVSALMLIMDLHQVGDGTFIPKSKDAPGDAGSLCFTFRLAPVRITGFAP